MSVTLYSGNELPDKNPPQLDPSAPFRILVLADLGATKPSANPIAVDCDDLDEAIQKLGVRAQFQLDENGPTVNVPIKAFDDFHPDRLVQSVELFDALRLRRKRMLDPKTFREELDSLKETDAPSQTSTTEQSTTSTDEAASLLDQAVNLTQARQTPLEEQVLNDQFDWDQYVRQLVAPHLVAKADPKQTEWIEQIDEVISQTMRRVLHHPKFQSLESTWSGIRFLTQRLETGRSLQIEVLHLELDALRQQLKETDQLEQTSLYKLLVETPSAEGESPWSIVVGDFAFSASLDDTTLLARIAKICQSAGSTFVAGATSEVIGCSSFGSCVDPDEWTGLSEEESQQWTALRQLSATRFICVTMPRFLGRRVYGSETDPIESFAFDELPDGNDHDAYLWVNSAFAAACVIGQSYLENGWDLQEALAGQIERLPLHYYDDQGEEVLKACGELFLVNRGAERMAAQGLSVCRSLKNDGAVRFDAIRSLSDSDSLLHGMWSSQ
ncbi:type VI secretion system contractile sheath large subunit [Thalassoglobus sp. JC818]|uniref:type VI secretion system contractile sheath domain-containing protein n=1 Tax=Thalassoglobus sp. JC818 TaxID=3232136 RepID=UPI003459DD98